MCLWSSFDEFRHPLVFNVRRRSGDLSHLSQRSVRKLWNFRIETCEELRVEIVLGPQADPSLPIRRRFLTPNGSVHNDELGPRPRKQKHRALNRQGQLRHGTLFKKEQEMPFPTRQLLLLLELTRPRVEEAGPLELEEKLLLSMHAAQKHQEGRICQGSGRCGGRAVLGS